MNKTITFILTGAFILTIVNVIAQVPLPLDSSYFPHPYDSIYIKSNQILFPQQKPLQVPIRRTTRLP